MPVRVPADAPSHHPCALTRGEVLQDPKLTDDGRCPACGLDAGRHRIEVIPSSAALSPAPAGAAAAAAASGEATEPHPARFVHPDAAELLRVEAVFAPYLRKLAEPGASDRLSQSQSARMKSKLGLACQICGWRSGEPRAGGYPGEHVVSVANAHILKNATICQAFGVEFQHPSNFLRLCGTAAASDHPSCHYAFDWGYLVLSSMNEDRTQWRVFASHDAYKHLNEKVVTLPQGLHRRVLHTMFMKAARNFTVSISVRSDLEITPPPSSEDPSPTRDEPAAADASGVSPTLG
eukprot:TRINITY_DN2062_c1_g1_i5.p1 TRINITY_DN2062_c1_g1~~TRINITY_DN2062_c1_g1_i5.p1  ORF type:complete len:292 (+),score=20.39 TRINITY_DN2062_c1_g1_i5:187-1062(+)